jgi:hypothetical protein
MGEDFVNRFCPGNEFIMWQQNDELVKIDVPTQNYFLLFEPCLC